MPECAARPATWMTMLDDPLRHTVSTSGASPGSMLNSTSFCAASVLMSLVQLGEPLSSLLSSSKVIVA